MELNVHLDDFATKAILPGQNHTTKLWRLCACVMYKKLPYHQIL